MISKMRNFLLLLLRGTVLGRDCQIWQNSSKFGRIWQNLFSSWQNLAKYLLFKNWQSLAEFRLFPWRNWEEIINYLWQEGIFLVCMLCSFEGGRHWFCRNFFCRSQIVIPFTLFHCFFFFPRTFLFFFAQFRVGSSPVKKTANDT